jgi:hypothetical protein
MSSSLFNAGSTGFNVLKRHVRTHTHVDRTSTVSRSAKEAPWRNLYHHTHHRCQRLSSSRHSSWPSSSSTKNWWQTPRFAITVKMSSAGGAGLASAALYAVVSNPAVVGAKPEDADQKAHHLKNGNGFVNPWDSFRDFVGWKMGARILW